VTAAVRVFWRAGPGGLPVDPAGLPTGELEFLPLPARPLPAGCPYALLGAGPAIPDVLDLVAVLPARPLRVFLVDPTDAAGPSRPTVPGVPVTCFVAGLGALPDRLGGRPLDAFADLTVRPSSTAATVLLGLREDLGSWEPSAHVWATA
jgi:hypothetical protein